MFAQTKQNKASFSNNVNFQHNYIFVHVPKTAGTSLAAALNIPHSNHHNAIRYRLEMGEQYAKMFKFCIVRNPWDRFLSIYDYTRLPESYHHSISHPELAPYGKHPQFDLISKLSLKECARLLIQGGFNEKDFFQWWPQAYWLTDDHGKIIVDYIGRFENLNETIQTISSAIKIDIKLPHLNRSRTEPINYRERMDQETVELIRQYYAKDIELLGYTF